MASSANNNAKGTLFSVSSLQTNVYDVICIGSGWAARSLAARAVKAGLTALVIDKDLIGGDCPFWACVPSKALLRPSEALDAANTVGGAKERITRETVDVQAVFRRRDTFTGGWDDEKLLVPITLETGADILRATGKIVGEKKVAVKSQDGHNAELTAHRAVAVCTGSVPTIPDIPGLKEAKPWTPREATSSSKVPTHLVIIGAGAVGCEMATAYSSLGSKVTVVNPSAEILSNLDHKAGRIVRNALEARGVEFLLQTSITQVQRNEDTSIILSTSSGASITASELLIAAGRKACTQDSGLDAFALPIDGTPLRVDESLCVKLPAGTTNNWLYAVGDINGRAPLTHMCKYQGRIAANAIIRFAKMGQQDVPSEPTLWDSVSATADHLALPRVIFTQPAVASVGLTRAAAEKQGRAIHTIEAPARTVGASLHTDTFGEGWAQWIVEAETNKLLGMTVVGQEVTELIHAATVAIVGGMRLEQLAHAVPPFPTMSEVYLNLAEAAGL